MKVIQKYLTDTQESVIVITWMRKGFLFVDTLHHMLLITVPVLCYFHEIDTKTSNSILKYDT